MEGAKVNKILLAGVTAFLLLYTYGGVYHAHSWQSLPVKDDRKVFMPGSQPHQAGTAESPQNCTFCHGGYDTAVEPAHNWRGSMMAQAVRDPIWLACLAVADQDSIWAVGNPNAGDICIRCHSPTGWLEGRSDPTNTAALTGIDFEGVHCDFCHRMVDPLAELRQPDVPPDPNQTAIVLAEKTYQQDIATLGTLSLFGGALPFLDPATNLPLHYGDGTLPNYVENVAGQYFLDPDNAKRAPFWDAAALHRWFYSRYHKSKTFCSTCHDVSNPVLASVVLGEDVPETQAASSYFHVERTTSEFLLSAYGRNGAATDIPGVPFAATCQDCHMRDVPGPGCSLPGVPSRDDLPLHDLTGGNQWISRILASADRSTNQFDPYNYEILSGQKYEGASIDVAGLQGQGQALWNAAERAVQQLQMAATLSVVQETRDLVVIRVQNNTGHKLISGFPEGRRMFLNVKFYDAAESVIGEINPYESLVTALDADGKEAYVSGGDIAAKSEELVWEAELSSLLTGEVKTFHFALATDRHKDNRIPPKGFDANAMFERLAQPRWEGTDAADYFSAQEYGGGYDDIIITKPAGMASWRATLYYQTTSKDYVEFLRDEINGVGNTLHEPTSAQNQGLNPDPDPAYLIQTDPFFQNIKGWGDAIWDLWLHNGGAEPIEIARVEAEGPFGAATCNDGLDNDSDGLTDGDDPGCQAVVGKVTICHMPPGNPSKAKTLSIGAAAVSAHLAHGDILGPCP